MIDSIKEKLIKEGENFINIRVVPFIKSSYPYLLSKIVIGLSGSCLYGEPNEKSDIDINILVNDTEPLQFNLTQFELEIKSLVERAIYPNVDVSVIKITSLGVNSFETENLSLQILFLKVDL